MTSKLLSQIFNQNSASIYDTLREHDAATSTDSDIDDLEERAGMIPASIAADFHDEIDPDDTEFELQQQSPVPLQGPSDNRRRFFPALSRDRGNLYRQPSYKDDEDIDVPQSLLFEPPDAEHDYEMGPTPGAQPGPSAQPTVHSPSAKLNARRLDKQWNAATAAANQHRHGTTPSHRDGRKGLRLGLVGPKERALWKWANVENLDNFLNDIYIYYAGKGIYNILLARLLNLLTLAFVVTFSTFLSLCVDYPKIHQTKRLADIMIPHCMSRMSNTATVLLWSISFFWVYKLITYLLDLRRLMDIYNFYTYLLEIPDSDMQTVSWQEVVARLMVLRDANPNTSDNLRRRNYRNASKQRMDAHDIANRLMRRENYLIALFNKEVLDLTVPLPFLRNRGGMLTRTLEWNLSQCILDYVFNEQGQFRTLFLKDTHRKSLSEGLRRRFIFAGTMNFIFAPFIVTYFLVLFLLRNLHDFIKTPARIGHRQYTPLAEWKFREFNELWHLFQLRLNMSYPAAESYVEQFPKEKTAQMARFVSFIAGSLLGVLAIGSLVDYELVTGFEIAKGFNVLSAIGILTTIVAVSRGMLPEENTVYDPEWSICNVISHTHYMPAEWKDNLHSDDVKREFMQLYALKVAIFVEEMLSVILTPFVLWISLPKCSDRIIDFFREFTVHVDGVGYVCSFAVFDFKKPGQHQVKDLRQEYFASKDNKMLTSYLGFMEQYNQGPSARGTPGRRQHGPTPYNMFSPALLATSPIDRRAQTRTPASVANVPRNPVQSILREGAGRMQSSMMRSSLLDHHHQPSHGNMHRTARPQGFQRSTGASLKEEDEDLTASMAGGPRFRSTLGESFDSTGMEETMADEAQPSDDGGGVLDLLNQFVGAQHGQGAGRAGVI